MAPFAVTLSDLIEKGGSYAGLAAFFGLAVLAILYFAQAREIRRLRDWAGRAPERAQELEERVIQQAETARKVKAQPIRRPGEPAPAAATAAGTGATAAAVTGAAPAPATAAGQDTVVSKPPPGVSETTDADEQAEQEGSATEHEVVKPAAATPEPAATPEEKPAEAQPATAEGEEEKPAEREAVPAGVVASAAVSESPSSPVAPGNGAPPSEPTLPPRATKGPPIPPVRRPAPAAQPLRASAPPVRRPGTPARRPGPPPPLRRDEPPSRRRTGIIAAGALAGITLIVVGLIAILGGGDDPATSPEPTAAAQTETVEPGTTGGGGGDTEEDPSAAGPTRAETAVAVLNGTTVAGLAATLDDKLLEAGYAEAQEPTNWTDSTRSASVVFYSGSEYRSQAIEVAELLQISDRQAIDDDALALAPEADVVVVVGADQTP